MASSQPAVLEAMSRVAMSRVALSPAALQAEARARLADGRESNSVGFPMQPARVDEAALDWVAAAQLRAPAPARALAHQALRIQQLHTQQFRKREPRSSKVSAN